MKNKWNRNRAYKTFEQKLYRQIGILIGVYALLICAGYTLADGKTGNLIVTWIRSIFGFSERQTEMIYQVWFRNHKEVIIVVMIMTGLLCVIRIFISFMSKYFDEISHGLDCLIAQDNEGIKLSPEMEFLAAKMNRCKERLRNRERAAKEAEQKKDDLVLYLAHDIRTPLTSVIGYLDLLEENPKMPEEERQKYIRIASEKADKLKLLTNDFFEITRFNTKSIVLVKTEFDLSFLLYQLADEFCPILVKKDQRIVCSIHEGSKMIGDAMQMARVFRNLVKNASVYGDSHSVITMKLEERASKIEVQIENKGKPIQKEQLHMIFEKFYRADPSRGTTEGNAGLGLAIAKEIVLLHQGEIFAFSKGNSMIFCVELPTQSE